MELSTFIRNNEEPIILGWQSFAKMYLPSAAHMDRTALRDHILGVLRFIADDLETPETEKERSDKAKGQGPKGGEQKDGAAGSHGDLRFAAGFNAIEMISEFRALRASVIKLWRAEWKQANDVLPDLLRFNEAVDQVMTESLLHFIENAKTLSDQVIQIMKKDIYDPILQVQNTAEKLAKNVKLDANEQQIIKSIVVDSSHIVGVVSNVIGTIESIYGINQSGSLPTLPSPKI